MYVPATDFRGLDYASLPHITDQSDPEAARRAYSSINELLDYRARQLPDKTFLCPFDRERGDFIEYTFDQIRRLVVRFATLHLAQLPVRKEGEKNKVVALIGPSILDHWLNDKAVQRLGHACLHISPSLSVSATLKLMEENKVQALLFGPGIDGDKFTGHIRSLPRLRWNSHAEHLRLFEDPPDAIELDAERTKTAVPPSQLLREAHHIGHTTGSTADPKSIPLPNHVLFGFTVAWPDAANPSYVAAPLSHAVGINFPIASLATGSKMYFHSDLPLSLPNIKTLLTKGVGRFNTLIINPMFLEILDSDPGGLEMLTSYDETLTSGAVVPPHLVTKMEVLEIPTRYLVGCSESGYMMETGKALKKDWMCLRVPDTVKPWVELKEYEAGLYMLVAKKGHPQMAIYNSEEGYITGDLYERHPVDEEKWRYVMRADDVISHHSGVKTDPTFIEGELLGTGLLKQAMVFGSGQTIASALLIPKSSSVTEFDIQPVIDKINSQVPRQSRLRPGLWKLLEVDSKFPISDKGVPVRKKTEAKYREVLEMMYRNATDELGKLWTETDFSSGKSD